jgi:hypothetical protein
VTAELELIATSCAIARRSRWKPSRSSRAVGPLPASGSRAPVAAVRGLLPQFGSSSIGLGFTSGLFFCVAARGKKQQPKKFTSPIASLPSSVRIPRWDLPSRRWTGQMSEQARLAIAIALLFALRRRVARPCRDCRARCLSARVKSLLLRSRTRDQVQKWPMLSRALARVQQHVLDNREPSHAGLSPQEELVRVGADALARISLIWSRTMMLLELHATLNRAVCCSAQIRMLITRKAETVGATACMELRCTSVEFVRWR